MSEVPVRERQDLSPALVVSGDIDDAQLETLEILQEQNGNLMRHLRPPRAALQHMPDVSLTPEQVTAVRYGQQITLPDAMPVQMLQGVTGDGELVAVLIPGEDENHWQPKMVLPANE